MNRRDRICKILNIASIVLLIAFVVMLIVDYINYNPLITSAPFYVNIIVLSITFLLPALCCLLARYIISKKH